MMHDFCDVCILDMSKFYLCHRLVLMLCVCACVCACVRFCRVYVNKCKSVCVVLSIQHEILSIFHEKPSMKYTVCIQHEILGTEHKVRSTRTYPA